MTIDSNLKKSKIEILSFILNAKGMSKNYESYTKVAKFNVNRVKNM